MVFRSLFGVITLQVATAILASVFFVVGFIVMGVNVFSYEKRDIEPDAWPVNLILVWVFVLLMNITGWFMFLSSYIPSRPLCYVSMVCITLIVVYWGTLTIISFINHPSDVRRVCVGYRCAESFWLGSFKFRSHPFFRTDLTYIPHQIRPFLPKPINRRKFLEFEEEFEISNTNLHSAPSIRDKDIKEDLNHNDYNHSSNSRVVESLGMKKRVKKASDYLSDNPEADAATNSPNTDVDGLYKLGPAFLGAVVFALVNLLFFVLSIVTVWAYSQELKWINPRERCYQTPEQCYEMSTIS